MFQLAIIIASTFQYANANLEYRMGELEPWIDENFIRSIWFGMGEQVNVKMIRDKFSGYVLTLICVYCVGHYEIHEFVMLMLI
jgi:hypothetical protein